MSIRDIYAIPMPQNIDYTERLISLMTNSPAAVVYVEPLIEIKT